MYLSSYTLIKKKSKKIFNRHSLLRKKNPPAIENVEDFPTWHIKAYQLKWLCFFQFIFLTVYMYTNITPIWAKKRCM
jgi:hypothetical protein